MRMHSMYAYQLTHLHTKVFSEVFGCSYLLLAVSHLDMHIVALLAKSEASTVGME